MSKSIVYLIGAGPGDYKLITLRALELIKRAECIIYDYLVNPYLLKFAGKNCKLIYVGKKAGAHILSQEGINKLLVKQAKIYKVVVRLKGGDPFIFGRGAEEAVYLKNNKIDFEVVPGITSAIAVPAYSGIPLTERSKNSTVGFITGNEDPSKKDSVIDWQALTKALGTMVFLMGVKNLSLIVKKLIECRKPKNTPVAIIRWGTTLKQKTIVGNLGNIVNLAGKNKISAPAIIVVGEVVNLRKQLNWFEKKPLLGKRIIVTRTREQASLLSEKLSSLGAESIEIPTIKIVPLKADKKVKQAFKDGCDWVIFSSQNGVSEFYEILNKINKDSRILGKVKVCAIGSETAKRLKQIGIKADYVPPDYVAESILKYFKGAGFKGKKVLILGAKQARDFLPKGLKAQGLIVEKIDLYDTCMPKESKLILKQVFKQNIDMVTFTSSSTVVNFIKLLGKNYKKILKGIKLASIGPITSKTIRKYGLRPNMQAKVYTIKGLVEGILKK